MCQTSPSTSVAIGGTTRGRAHSLGAFGDDRVGVDNDSSRTAPRRSSTGTSARSAHGLLFNTQDPMVSFVRPGNEVTGLVRVDSARAGTGVT